MSELVTLAEAEDRLRRTLARRAGDVPPAGDDPVPLRPGDPDLTLVATLPSGPRRRRRLVAAAAAAICVAGAAAVGVAAARGAETADIVPADEAPTTATTPAIPDRLATTTIPAPPVTDPSAQPPVQPLEDGQNGVDPAVLPTLVAGFGQPGVAPNQEIWLFATFYPKPDMADAVAPGDTREAIAGAEVPADLDTAGDYPAISVWLRYEDGVLGLHSGMVSHDEMVAMALTVRRIPGTRDFTMTPPAGWELTP